jgi:hypothetical protein
VKRSNARDRAVGLLEAIFMSEFIHELTIASSQAHNKHIGSLLLDFVTHDNRTALESARLKVSDKFGLRWLNRIWKHLGVPSQLTVEEKRTMEAAVYLGAAEGLTEWLKSHILENGASAHHYFAAYLNAFGQCASARVAAGSALINLDKGEWLECRDGTTNAAGQFILALSDDELVAVGRQATFCHAPLRLLLTQSPDRVPTIVHAFLHDHAHDVLHQHDKLSIECCRLLLGCDLHQYRSTVLAAANEEECVICQASVFAILADYFPHDYMKRARELNVALLLDCPGPDGFRHVAENAAFAWLLERFGASILPELQEFFAAKAACKSRLDALDLMHEKVGQLAVPGFIAALNNPYDVVQRKALSHLIDCDFRENDNLIANRLAQGLQSSDEYALSDFVELAGRSCMTSLAERLWGLSGHHSKNIRKAAAKALERFGERVQRDATRYIVTDNPDIRATAVRVLAAA